MTQVNEQESATDQAVVWHVRLRSGDATEGDWTAFTDWLEADAEHELAYRQVEDLSIELGDAKGDILEGLNGDENVAEMPIAFPQRGRFLQGSWGRGITGIAASLIVIVGAWSIFFGQPSTATYATGVGGKQLVELEDGSSIQLNTRTEITVAMSGSERSVKLVEGQAFFDVAKDRDRPFVVKVGEQTVRVVGTQFGIFRRNGGVTVTVARGIVDVTPAGKPEIARLEAGRQFFQKDNASLPEIRNVDPATVMAWRSGHAIYDDRYLSDVAEDLSRYFSIPIEVHDGETGSMKFSGVLKVDDQGALLSSLEQLLPLAAEAVDGKFVLRKISRKE